MRVKTRGRAYPDRTVGPGNAAGGSSQPRDAGTADGQAAGEGLRAAAAQTAQLARFRERDPLRLADLLIPSVDAFLEAALARQGGERILTGTGTRPGPLGAVATAADHPSE